ncbi:MAG: hypothetical protein ABMA25_14955 [Ilumatobacteraceae bacterium]
MWPHSLQIVVGEAVVGVGTDDDELVARLAPWAALEAVAPSRTPDFGLELHPAPPVHRAQPRALPSSQHGTLVIGRTTDAAALRDGLLRTLASIGEMLTSGLVRLNGLPLLIDGQVVLAPPEVADRGSLRRLRNAGHVPVYVPSVVVDPATLLVHIPAPLGAPTGSIAAPLREWWLPSITGAENDAVPPRTLGQLAAHATPLLAPPWFEDELDGPAADAAGTRALRALIALIERLPPRIGRFDR